MKRREFVTNGSGLLLGSALPFRAFLSTFNDPLRAGVIGTGIRGKQLISSIVRSAHGLQVIAICDILAEPLNKAEQVVGKPVKRYTNYHALLDDKNIDVVFIATPLYLHFEMAAAAIAAGKHVYLEKTMAYNIEQTIKLTEQAIRSEKIVQVGYQERYSLLFQQINRLLKNKACGEITYIDCNWNRNGNWRQPVLNREWEKTINWRMYREYSGGLMAELCSHQMDLVHWLTQKRPSKVMGMGGIDYWKDGRETFDNVTALFEYEGGLKARYTALTTNAKEGFRMKFFGTRATIEVNRENGQQGFIYPEQHPQDKTLSIDAITRPSPSWNPAETGIQLEVDAFDDSTTRSIREFAMAIRQNTQPVSNAGTAAISSIAVHMANEAIENNRIVYWNKNYF